MEERLRKRLAKWKRLYISKGERITLILSTMASLRIYFMSLFLIPRLVRQRIEQIQRDFLWQGGALEKRPHLVKWMIILLGERERKVGDYGALYFKIWSPL